MSTKQDSKPIVVVIGAAGGIGKAIGSTLEGRYRLFGIDKASQPKTWHGYYRQLNLNSMPAILSLMNNISHEPGVIHAVVFAAGVYLRRPLLSYDSAKLDDVLWSNFTSVLFITQQILPRMVRQGRGRLIMISSQAAVLGGYDPVYAASKGAINSFMKSIAREYGRKGIRCNAISPGPVSTPMTTVMGKAHKAFYRKVMPIGRFATPSEIATLVRFLVDGSIDSIHGAILDIDGGLVRR